MHWPYYSLSYIVGTGDFPLYKFNSLIVQEQKHQKKFRLTGRLSTIGINKMVDKNSYAGTAPGNMYNQIVVSVFFYSPFSNTGSVFRYVRQSGGQFLKIAISLQ